MLSGLLLSLHLKLDHPKPQQLKSVCRCFFFALAIDQAIDHTSANYHICLLLKKCPKISPPQVSSDPSYAIGVSFAADVIQRERQMILPIRECVTSYKVCSLIPDEQKVTLRDHLIKLCAELIPLDGHLAVIRTEAYPGFIALTNDELLAKHRKLLKSGSALIIIKILLQRETCIRT